MAPQSTIMEEPLQLEKQPERKPYKMQIIWRNVVLLSVLHIIAIYGFYIGVLKACWKAWLFAITYTLITGLGITAGGHRLWCHRSYKAKLPLRIFLGLCHGMAAQTDLYTWCRDHRVHHKYSETDADPHNIKRGFFFAHCGWLMCKKHPDVIEKGKDVDTSDLLADPVVRFERKYHIPLSLFFGFFVPVAIPHYLYGLPTADLFYLNIGRYVLLLNGIWCINSVAHTFGSRPFNKSIAASDASLLAFFANGEGWHNYHHVFPFDYAASELGYKNNLSKVFIDLVAWLGLAYDLKTASEDVILKAKLKHGDGSRM